MTGRIWIPPLAVLAVTLGYAGACAQSVGPDEVVSQDAATQQLALTPAQRSAIYNAVLQQRARASTSLIQPTVGAPGSPSVPLSELPDQAADTPWAQFLKYAMVEDDVVVVDPIRMRVVDIIRDPRQHETVSRRNQKLQIHAGHG